MVDVITQKNFILFLCSRKQSSISVKTCMKQDTNIKTVLNGSCLTSKMTQQTTAHTEITQD